MPATKMAGLAHRSGPGRRSVAAIGVTIGLIAAGVIDASTGPVGAAARARRVVRTRAASRPASRKPAPTIVPILPTTTTTGLAVATTAPSTRAPATPEAVVAAVGDVACRPGEATTPLTCRQKAVSDLLVADTSLAKVLLLGDLQYDNGELDGFRQSFEPTYGRLGDKLVPAPGNHEYNTPHASGYYDYFGAAAHPESNGYYSLDIGRSWHVVVLNSNCDFVRCDASSDQVRWLRSDLARSTRPCTIAIWHHPRFTSAERGGNVSTAAFFDALDAAGADIVLSGHEHQYERFDPQRPDETPDAVRGIREWVVGTGGRSTYPFASPRPNSVVRAVGFGYLRLTLLPGSYAWSFVAEPGTTTVTDSGSDTCH